MSNTTSPPTSVDPVLADLMAGSFLSEDHAVLAAGVVMRIETVLPERAEAFLTHNLVNRTPRPYVVRKYAAQMQKGQWRLTGEAIIFSDKGELLNGQNRLMACVKAGVPFIATIIYGISKDAMRVMDTTIRRTPADLFGFMGIPNKGLMATATKNVITLDLFTHHLRRSEEISNDDLVERFFEDQDLFEEFLPLAAACYRNIQLPKATGLAMGVMFSGIDPAVSRDFMSGLTYGIDLTDGDPRLTLRNWMIRQRSLRSAIRMEEYVATSIKAWNAYVNNTSLRQMRAWKHGNAWPIMSQVSPDGVYSASDPLDLAA